MKKVVSLLLVLTMILTLPIFALAEEDSFGAGTTEENAYWNDSLKIGCTFGDEWYFYTDDEILENNQAVVGQLKDDLAEAIREAGTMMDMMAMNTETGENVNVNLERMSLANSLIYTEDAYVKASVDQLASALEQMGMENVTAEQDEMEFMGEKHPCIRVSGTLEDVELFETLAVVKSGRTMIVVTACSYFEDTTADILSSFYREKP